MSRFMPVVPALWAAAAAVLLAGCSGRQTRRDVYMHIMTPEQQAHFRDLEAEHKPVSLKLAYLQGIGVYQEWAELPKERQDAILQRRVSEGMTPLEVRMALGEPDRIEDATRPADRDAGHERVLWHYDASIWQIDRGGGPRRVCFLDDRVLWARRP